MSESTGPASALAPPVRAWLGPALVMCGAIGIGFAPIGLRLGLAELGPQAIAFWRYVLALPILLLLLIVIERRLPARPVAPIIIAGACFALDIGLWHWALERTTVANATFIVNLGNVCVGLLAWLILKERPTAIWIGAVAIAVLGAGFLSQGGGADGKASLSGDLLALGAAFMVAFYLLYSKVARVSLGAMDVIFWLTATEAVVALALTLVAGEALLPARAEGFLAPLFLAIIVQIGGQGLIIAGLGRTPAAIAGVLMLIQPVTAAAISWRMFEEPLNTIQVLGAGLILTGVFLAQRGAAQRPVKTVSELS